jgi:hypothetical protein
MDKLPPPPQKKEYYVTTTDISHHVKAAVCKQVKIQTVVLWLTPCSLVGEYQHFRGKHCPHHPVRQHMKTQCNKNAPLSRRYDLRVFLQCHQL